MKEVVEGVQTFPLNVIRECGKEELAERVKQLRGREQETDKTIQSTIISVEDNNKEE